MKTSRRPLVASLALALAATIAAGSASASSQLYTVNVNGFGARPVGNGAWGENFGALIHTSTATESAELPISLVYNNYDVDGISGTVYAGPYLTQSTTLTATVYGSTTSGASICSRLYGISTSDTNGATFYGGNQVCGVSNNGTSKTTVPGPTTNSYGAINYAGGYAFLWLTVTGTAQVSSVKYASEI